MWARWEGVYETRWKVGGVGFLKRGSARYYVLCIVLKFTKSCA